MEKNCPTADYALILADMEAKKAALEAAISSLRTAIGAGALGAAGDLPPGTVTANGSSFVKTATTLVDGTLPRGALLGKPGPEAIKIYLSAVRKKQTNKEIAQALEAGGVVSTTKNFSIFVAGALFRLKEAGEVLRFDDGWGLAEWYPESFRNRMAQDQGKGAKKKGKPRGKKKNAQQSTPEPKAERQSASADQGLKPTARIQNLLPKAPGELKSDAIAKQAGIGSIRVAEMVLGTMVKKGSVEKTPSGGYRKAS